MIKLYDATGAEHPVDLSADHLPPDVVLIDLLRAEPAEVAFVERVTGVRLPSPQRLSEVETSSRLAMQGEAILVTSPVVYRDEDGDVDNTPVGFVLVGHLLVTIRFVELKAFADVLSQQPFRVKDPEQGNVEILLDLLEVTVDRMADAMEQVGADLDDDVAAYLRARSGGPRVEQARPGRAPAGAHPEDHRAKRRPDLPRPQQPARAWPPRGLCRHARRRDLLSPDAKARLETLRQDIASLNEYETRLTDKVQFLLDSTLGFINIEQNRTFKILTVASVIGIPPTFVVGLYGMNFKNMPEYDWAYGYQWGLALIVAQHHRPDRLAEDGAAGSERRTRLTLDFGAAQSRFSRAGDRAVGTRSCSGKMPGDPTTSRTSAVTGGGGGGGFGIPIGGGGLGIGAIIILALIGYVTGIDPRVLIGGAEQMSNRGQSYQQQYQTSTAPRSRPTRPGAKSGARPRTRWAISLPPSWAKRRTSGARCCRPRRACNMSRPSSCSTAA